MKAVPKKSIFSARVIFFGWVNFRAGFYFYKRPLWTVLTFVLYAGWLFSPGEKKIHAYHIIVPQAHWSCWPCKRPFFALSFLEVPVWWYTFRKKMSQKRKKAPPYFERSQITLRMFIVQYVYSTEWGAVFEQEIEKSKKKYFFKANITPNIEKRSRADRKRSIVPLFQSMPSTLIIIADTIFAKKRHFSDDSCEMCFPPLLFLRRRRNISGQGEGGCCQETSAVYDSDFKTTIQNLILRRNSPPPLSNL